MPVVTRSIAKQIEHALTTRDPLNVSSPASTPAPLHESSELPSAFDHVLKSVEWCVDITLTSYRPMGHVEQTHFNKLTQLFQFIDDAGLETEEVRASKIEDVCDYLTLHLTTLLDINPERWFKLALVVQIKALFFEYKHQNVAVMYVHPLKPATIERMLTKFHTLRHIATNKLKARHFKPFLKQANVVNLVGHIAKWVITVERMTNA